VESLGIALYLLAGLFAAPIFCFALVRLVRPTLRLARLAYFVAIALLALLAVELTLVSVRGVVGARQLVGPAFFLFHVLVTFTAAPALAGALLLGRRGFAKWWPAVAALCWVVAAVAIFYQYGVAEALYGID
jgi:hypothetical protein